MTTTTPNIDFWEIIDDYFMNSKELSGLQKNEDITLIDKDILWDLIQKYQLDWLIFYKEYNHDGYKYLSFYVEVDDDDEFDYLQQNEVFNEFIKEVREKSSYDYRIEYCTDYLHTSI